MIHELFTKKIGRNFGNTSIDIFLRSLAYVVIAREVELVSAGVNIPLRPSICNSLLLNPYDSLISILALITVITDK